MLLPAMLYAASVWITPQRRIEGRKHLHGSVGIIRKLARIHRQACILISGAMRTTATDVLEAHLNILPFHLLVDVHISRDATCLCSLPTTHPLHLHVRRATTFVKRHRSPLHEILEAYHLRPDDVETIEAVRLPPGWRPPFPISIAPSKDDAAAAEAGWVAKPGYRVYTDGSDCDGGVGASAVLYRPGIAEPTVLRYRLGDSTRHSVYEAEIVGLLLAAHLLLALLSFHLASCAADNKACLLAVCNRKPHPAHYLIDDLLLSLESVKRRHPGAKLTLRWIPGHRDLEGNERADLEAKRAARGEASPPDSLPHRLATAPLPASLSKVRQTLRASFQATARTEWALSPRAVHLARIDDSLPSKNFLRLIDPLPRRHASLLIQLRTGHAPLNLHLHRITKAESPTCPQCGHPRETVAHYILDCVAYGNARARLTSRLGPAAYSLQTLLTEPKAVRLLFHYIHDTRRFAATYGDLLLPDHK